MASIRKPAINLISANICRQCARSLARQPLAQRTGRALFSQQPQRWKDQFASRHPYALQHEEIKTDYKVPSTETKVYDFQQVKNLTESPSSEQILIDVREPSEYEGGYIPGAINMPIKSQPDALFLPEEEFEDRFGFEKPSTDKEVIFYCKSGVRSSAAAQFALQQGYTNVSEYRGSWLDWQKQGGEASKP